MPNPTTRLPSERILAHCISDDMVTQYMGSATFGPAGPDCNRRTDYRPMGLGWLLYGFTRATRPKAILEIGVGGSTLPMLYALRHNQTYPERQGHLWGIDNFQWGDLIEREGIQRCSSYWHFVDTLHDLAFDDLITFHYAKSQEVAHDLLPHAIDMLVVDGDHGQAEVTQDWLDFSRYLVPGGYAFFHDVVAIPNQIGMPLEAFCSESSEFRMLVEPDHYGYAIIQKKFTLDARAVLETRYRAAQPDHETTPYQLSDARTIGAVLPWQGSYFPTEPSWETVEQAFWNTKVPPPQP